MAPDCITRLTHNGLTPWLADLDGWRLGLLDEVMWLAELQQEEGCQLLEHATNWGLHLMGLN